MYNSHIAYYSYDDLWSQSRVLVFPHYRTGGLERHPSSAGQIIDAEGDFRHQRDLLGLRSRVIERDLSADAYLIRVSQVADSGSRIDSRRSLLGAADDRIKVELGEDAEIADRPWKLFLGQIYCMYGNE
jgi:hypothetical protein